MSRRRCTKNYFQNIAKITKLRRGKYDFFGCRENTNAVQYTLYDYIYAKICSGGGEAMQEGEQTPRRRRRRPEIKEEPIKIVIGSEEQQPDWMVSADAVTGAASRRSGTKGSARKQPESEEGDSEKKPIAIPIAAKKPKPEIPAEIREEKEEPKAAAVRSGPQFHVAESAFSDKESTPRPKTQKASGSKKKKRKNSGQVRKRITLGVVGICLAAGLFFGIRALRNLIDIKETLDRGENVFYENIYMNDIPLAGKTLDEAAAVVIQQVDSLLSGFRITLRTQDGRTWDITGDELKMQYDVADQLDQVWTIGHNGTSSERYAQVKQLQENPVRRYTSLTYDLSTVNQILAQIKEEVDEPAVNATRVEDDTKWPPFSYTDDVPGQTLDITGLNEQITSMINRLESGVVELTPVPVEAKVTRKALEESIVKLSSYETAVGATSHEGRFTNIEIGTKKFNHLIIHSGETVSFNKVAGKRTEQNGYVEAPEIAYGEYVMGIGGGICQVSSTLYNAVVNAGLEVVKRTQHSLASNYVPMGMDATVADDRLDFIFRNTTNADLYFETSYYKKKNYWYTQFTIYGRPDPNGYSYKLESEVREEIPLPEPTYRPDRTQTYVVYDNETYQISKGEKGYIVDVYLVTLDSKGLQISRELKYTDTYKARAPIYWIGTTPRATSVPFY